jgi:hypothetical protein
MVSGIAHTNYYHFIRIAKNYWLAHQKMVRKPLEKATQAVDRKMVLTYQ